MVHLPFRTDKLIVLFLFIFLSGLETKAVVYYTLGNGFWTNTSNWSTYPIGPSCNCYPNGMDSIVINHTIILNKNMTNGLGDLGELKSLLKINSGGHLTGSNSFDFDVGTHGYLYNCGKLTIRNLQFDNNSTVYVCSGATVTVNGNFTNRNNSNNIRIDGSFTVNGAYSNGLGGVILGSGNIFISNGPVLNSGNTYGCIGYNPCSGFPCVISSPCGSSYALPVQLSSFEIKLENNLVVLEWTTESELNNDYFSLEHAGKDGEFSSFLQVAGNGNKTVQTKYHAVHTNPVYGENYYRLRQFDYDGNNSLSDVRRIFISSKGQLQIYPNPANADQVVVSLKALPEPLNYFVMINAFGKEIYKMSAEHFLQKDVPVQLGEQVLLNSGIYTIIATTASGSYVQRLLVQ